MIEGLKPYAEYKESDIPWARALPTSWQTERAKRLFTKMQRPVRPDDDVITCFRDGMVTLRKNRRLRGFTEATVFSGYQGIRKGDLVIHGMDAFAGAIGVSDSDGKGTPVYNVCKPGPGVVANYYAHTVREMSRSEWILALAKGIRERSTDFRYEMFGNQIVPLPPPDEQAAIVRFLDHANRKIDGWVRAKRKLIGLLNEQKQAIIHRAVTRGLHPDVPLKPSGIPWLGDIPKHWEVLPLGRVLVERKESNDPIKTKNILSLSLHDGVVPYAEKTRPGGNKAKDDLTAYKLAYPGDIVVNSMNVVVGSVGLSRYFGAVSPVYYMLRPRQGKDTVEYFDSIFHDVAFQRSLFVLGNGIMVIQSKSSGKLNTIRMRIPMGKLNRVEIPYPPPSEQQAIVAGIGTEIAPVTTAIARTEREIALMQEYRTRLTADLVTGKLDVREAAAHLPAPPAAAPAEPVPDEPLEEIETEETE
ncbi:restriction endonuclease subunit S [Prosthecobacter sp.]